MKYPEPKQNRQGRWIVEYYHQGVRNRSGYGTLEAATEFARFAWECLLKGRDPQAVWIERQAQAAAQEKSLYTYWPDFLDRHGQRVSPNTRASYECSWKHVGADTALVYCPMQALKPVLVDDYMRVRLSTGASVSTVVAEVNLVRAMLTRALKDGLIDSHPLKGRLDMPKEDNKRVVNLSLEDQRRLLTSIRSQMHRDLVTVAIYTGKRKAELFGLRVEDIEILPADIKGRVFSRVTVRLKGGKFQTLMVSPHATEILIRRIGGRQEGFIFQSRTGGRLSAHAKITGFEKAVAELGLYALQGGRRVPLCFHDLRRVWADNSLEAGADIFSVSSGLGHEEVATTTRHYTRCRDGRLIAERQERIGLPSHS